LKKFKLAQEVFFANSRTHERDRLFSDCHFMQTSGQNGQNA